ncbi:MAG: hypothetical protein EAZ28_12070 [Oscillatoriales cyanobacterium]|nr:MAG: hypothetical protein EAZ28_12070 [Oscillatoriales cyanobacterium]
MTRLDGSSVDNWSTNACGLASGAIAIGIGVFFPRFYYQYFGQFFNGAVSRGRGSPAIFYAFSETSALNSNMKKNSPAYSQQGFRRLD